MSSRKLENQVNRELRRITESIPRELLEKLTKTEIIAPTTKGLFEKALTTLDLTDEQRERFQIIVDSGVLDRKVEVVDFDTEKLIDAYITAEIDLAVKAGRLPKEAPEWNKLKRKGKKYAKRQQKRLKELFSAGQNKEAGAHQDGAEHTRADRPRGSDGEILPNDGEHGAG